MYLVKMGIFMTVMKSEYHYWNNHFANCLEIVGVIRSEWILIDHTQPDATMRNVNADTQNAVRASDLPRLNVEEIRENWERENKKN